MKTYEYKILQFVGSMNTDQITLDLDEEGSEGWELAAVDERNNLYYFKREIIK